MWILQVKWNWIFLRWLKKSDVWHNSAACQDFTNGPLTKFKQSTLVKDFLDTSTEFYKNLVSLNAKSFNTLWSHCLASFIKMSVLEIKYSSFILYPIKKKKKIFGSATLRY
jgi:hypothetical protein